MKANLIQNVKLKKDEFQIEIIKTETLYIIKPIIFNKLYLGEVNDKYSNNLAKKIGYKSAEEFFKEMDKL